MVILLRSRKNKADVLLETLRSADIPAYASVNAGYFAETEIQVMLALLRRMLTETAEIVPVRQSCSPAVTVIPLIVTPRRSGSCPSTKGYSGVGCRAAVVMVGPDFGQGVGPPDRQQDSLITLDTRAQVG